MTDFIFSASLNSHPPHLWGGVRGRDSELAGGAIISKDKPPPASAKALAPPPEAGGEMIEILVPPILGGGHSIFTLIMVFACDPSASSTRTVTKYSSLLPVPLYDKTPMLLSMLLSMSKSDPDSNK